jgi:ubiquinone/menaquinone biosynthesis C-methylase UbiE
MTTTFHDHFSKVAPRYADFRPHYPRELFQYLATLRPRDTVVWDCAAGNGQATVDLAEHFQSVIATDASAEQIASAPSHPRVDYRVAPAEHSGLPDHSIGLVTVAQALHWFDLDRFYSEVQRVVRPQGFIAVWAYGNCTVEGDAVNQMVHDFYSKTVGDYWPPERKLVEEGYRTIPFPFSEIPAKEFRMEDRWTLERLLGYFGTWSATNRYIKALGHDPLGPLETALKKVWGEPQRVRQVFWPLSVRVGQVI